MGKQFTVTGVPAGVSLPSTAMYAVGNTVTLSDATFAELPSWYSAYYSGLTTVSDPIPDDSFGPLKSELNGTFVQRAGGTSGTVAKLTQYNVIDFGATGDGTTDDSTAIQAAITACQIGAHFSGLGGAVYFPYGKYYVATGLTCTNPGTQFIGQGGPGTSDDLATGSTQIIVGNGIWGLSVGVDGTSEYRGYNVENLHFFEKNAGQALGGLRILSSSNGSYSKVSAGSFTAGTGILIDGHSGAVQAQYNTFADCRVGKCAVGFENKFANGTRLIGGYFEGSHNGQAPTASSVGLKLTSGDTFRSFGTVFQGYDTLVSVAGVYNPELHGARFEVWTTAAISVASGCLKGKFFGDGDNSLNSNSGTGVIIASGATDIEAGVTFRNVKTLYADAGTRTRYPNKAGLAIGGTVLGNVVGQRPVYAPGGTLMGYEPLYDAITGTYLVSTIGAADPGTTSTSSVTITVPSTGVAAGDTIVIGAAYGLSGSSPAVSVSDSKGNTYTLDRQDDNSATGSTFHTAILSAPVTTPLVSGDTITVTFASAVNYPFAAAFEYFGMHASRKDQASGAHGTSAAPAAGSVTTGYNNELVFSMLVFQDTANFTAGTNGTALASYATTGRKFVVQTQPQNNAGAINPGASLSSSVDWTMSSVTYRTATPGAGSGGGASSLTSQSNMISSDVTMTTAGTFYDGPSLTLAAGTYLLIGSVGVKGSTTAARTFNAKLWDGTNTAVASAQGVVSGSAQAGVFPMPVAAIVTPGSSTTYKISASSTVNADIILGTGAQTSYLIAVKIG